MAFQCPTCQKRFFPFMAAFGGQSSCTHCKTTFRATPAAKKVALAAALVGLGIARFIEKFLKSFVLPETAFLLVLAGIIFFGVAIVELTPVQTSVGHEDNS
jgi:hypothetical protein